MNHPQEPHLAAPPIHRTKAPSLDEIGDALDVLDQLAWSLRDPVLVADVQPQLAKALDEEYGVPMILGTLLRNTAHYIEMHALSPWSEESRHIIARLRAAAPELTDCHDLHWDMHRLGGLPFDARRSAGYRAGAGGP
ncbi:hypothetical protein G3I32_12995 [Streptomyces coelicoflavus]|uniref:Uncharacterized protein n=1 Tax=Streptomyces coelicoflavus TaxID=285562 RepID=A0A7K3PKG7_9ACTN|nr:hypothetical protein [Streptomyces coelicoflavus]NEB09769.1 hypothetical protein [Streptomyces coelicoflavus]